jgi:hypothetical protein
MPIILSFGGHRPPSYPPYANEQILRLKWGYIRDKNILGIEIGILQEV